MNDWKYSQFIKSVIIIQVLFLFTVGLELYGINIPILTQLITFIYITFIPGYLILRILRLHQLGNIKSVLFAAGLGIISINITGFLMNMTLPVLGILNPISIIPLAVLMSFYVMFLSILSYRDKDFQDPAFIDSGDLLSPLIMFLCITPFLAIFGSYSVNFYDNNLISMFLFIFIVLIAGAVVFNKIKKDYYPFAVWIIAISLVLVSSLVSTYIWGWDIQKEYFLVNTVFNNNYWNFTFGDAYNAMLSIVILAPVYSILMNIDLVYVLKIIYPFLFSLVPLGLYKLFSEQIDPKIAFLACLLLVSFNTFFIEMLTLGREMIAELFLVLVLLAVFSNGKKSFKGLFLIFGIGLIISHYSLTYYSLFIFMGALMLLFVFYLYKWFIGSDKGNLPDLGKLMNSRINLFIVALVSIFTYLWYSYIADGLAIRGLTDNFKIVEDEISQKIVLYTAKLGFADFYLVLLSMLLILALLFFIALKFMRNKFKTDPRDFSLNKLIRPLFESKMKYTLFAILSIILFLVFVFMVGKPQTWIVGVQRYMNFVLVFFTLSGFLISFLHLFGNNFKKEYYALSVMSIMVLLAGIFIPAVEGAFNISRIVQMTFLFLSPFCVIGGIMVFKSIIRALKIDVNYEMPVKIFYAMVVIFLLFNTGFFSVLSDQSIPMHLSKESDYYPRFDIQETTAAKWLYEEKINYPIFADTYGTLVFNKYTYSTPIIAYYKENQTSYIFLRRLNRDNKLLVSLTNNQRNYEDKTELIKVKNRIYDNGEARSYFS